MGLFAFLLVELALTNSLAVRVAFVVALVVAVGSVMYLAHALDQRRRRVYTQYSLALDRVADCRVTAGELEARLETGELLDGAGWEAAHGVLRELEALGDELIAFEERLRDDGALEQAAEIGKARRELPIRAIAERLDERRQHVDMAFE